MRTLLLCAAVVGMAAAAGQTRSWESYREQTRRQLDAIGAQIDALEDGARHEGAKTRKRLKAQVAELRVQKTGAERELTRLATAARRDREALKAKLDGLIHKLERALNRKPHLAGGRRHPPRGG